MAQYKVPQNVDIADKVIGGLTLRQFAFLMFAGAIILALYYILVGPLKFLFWPLALIIGGFGAALAFLKINDRPFEIFLISVGKSFIKPAKRVWIKEDVPVQHEVQKAQTQGPKPQEPSYGEVKSNLDRLAMIVDTGGMNTNDQQRISNIQPRTPDEPTGLQDVLSRTEQNSPGLEKYITDAEKTAGKGKKKEPTISSFSSMPVTRDQYSYEKLDLQPEDDLNNMVNHANQNLNTEPTPQEPPGEEQNNG